MEISGLFIKANFIIVTNDDKTKNTVNATKYITKHCTICNDALMNRHSTTESHDGHFDDSLQQQQDRDEEQHGRGQGLGGFALLGQGSRRYLCGHGECLVVAAVELENDV